MGGMKIRRGGGKDMGSDEEKVELKRDDMH